MIVLLFGREIKVTDIFGSIILKGQVLAPKCCFIRGFMSYLLLNTEKTHSRLSVFIQSVVSW